MGIREQKKKQTWLALHRAALDLACAHGVNEVTTEQIAAAAGVSARTFFNYFSTKEAALVGLRDEAISPMAEALQDVPDDTAPLDALYVACCALLTDFIEDPDLWRRRRELLSANAGLLRLASARNHNTEHQLAMIIAERLGCAEDEDPYPSLVVGAAMAALRATIRFHGPHPETDPFETLRGAFDLLTAGLPVPERFGE
ncbi:TetR/AcrR family transcriptional regulator [Enemella sp. A6]|uniref:TetR/AcrR family transcriptional regulator n=1 Tax=Enemella sp. A6 TaxID=3440152 RepID=UPI003EBFF32C